MIKKTIAILALAFLISFTDKQQPEPEFIVRGTLPEWQAILSNPDDVAKNYRDKVVTKFVSQLNDQIKLIDSLAKQKAIQDSIKNKKN